MQQWKELEWGGRPAAYELQAAFFKVIIYLLLIVCNRPYNVLEHSTTPLLGKRKTNTNSTNNRTRSKRENTTIVLGLIGTLGEEREKKRKAS